MTRSRFVQTILFLIIATFLAMAVFFSDVSYAWLLSMAGVTVVIGGLWFGLAQLSSRHALGLILGTALALRLLWVFGVHNRPVSDFAVYHELAHALVSGQGYALTGPVGAEDLELYLGTDKQLPYTTAYRAPGTALWGAALFKLFGDHVIVFKLSNVVLDVGTVLLLYLLLNPIAHPVLARRASFLWAVYPTAIMACNLFGSETLFTFFLMLIAWMSVKQSETSRLPLLALGLLIAWTSLVRPMFLELLLAVGVALACALPWQRAGRSLLLLVCIAGVGISPWTIRNWIVFHRLIPICTDEGEFLGRHTGYLLYPDLQTMESDPAYRAWRQISNEVDRSHQGYVLAVSHLRALLHQGWKAVGHGLYLTLRKGYSDDEEILFWSVTRAYHLVPAEGSPTALSFRAIARWRLYVAGFYVFILLGALLGVVRNALDLRRLHFLAAFFVLSFMATLVVLAEPRYHFSMMPFLVVLAAAGYPTLIQKDS